MLTMHSRQYSQGRQIYVCSVLQGPLTVLTMHSRQFSPNTHKWIKVLAKLPPTQLALYYQPAPQGPQCLPCTSKQCVMPTKTLTSRRHNATLMNQLLPNNRPGLVNKNDPFLAVWRIFWPFISLCISWNCNSIWLVRTVPKSVCVVMGRCPRTGTKMDIFRLSQFIHSIEVGGTDLSDWQNWVELGL